MADVKIRKLDDWVLAAYRARAKAVGHSLEEELRQTLGEVASQRRQAYLDEVMTLQEELHAKYGEMPDSTPLIREERDRRG
jgi:plasmid stability protein